MSNNTIYPYGTNGELPSSIGIVNDLITGGADKALSAEQGVVLSLYSTEELIDSLDGFSTWENNANTRYRLYSSFENNSSSVEAAVYIPNFITAQLLFLTRYDASTGVMQPEDVTASTDFSNGDISLVNTDSRASILLINMKHSDNSEISSTEKQNLLQQITVSVVSKTTFKDETERLDYQVFGASSCETINNIEQLSVDITPAKKRYRLYAQNILSDTYPRFNIEGTIPSGFMAQVILMTSYSTSTGIIDSTNSVAASAFTKGAMNVSFVNNEYSIIMLNFKKEDDSVITDEQIASLRTSFLFTITLKGEPTINEKIDGLEDKIDIKEFVNICDYGAKGDGINDDTSALVTAIALKGDIYIPNGIYLVTSSIPVYSDTHIKMERGAIIKRNDNIKSIFYSNYDANTTSYNGITNFTIEGGTLDLGEGFTQGGCGLGFVHASNLIIKDMTIKHVNSGYHSIDIGGSKNVLVDNCIFTDMLTNSIYAECVQIDATGSKSAFPILDIPDNSPCFDNTPCLNVEIRSCKFYTNNYSPAIGGHNTGLHKYINIHDNIIVGTSNQSVRGSIAFDDSSNNTDFVYIHDNFISNYYYGFQFGANKNIWVKNNILENINVLRSVDSGTNGSFIDNIEITTT